eukprot:TRINITY_DN41529_c0_g1_i1.p1 TRINITY_DN41529_c0_g1~~TRINITY_DN41529_c0_g1_i1.p1  ORF type:complete len:242 (+),score=41.68 TRINITY_DN41529_c0_g1_i1:41-766(+)
MQTNTTEKVVYDEELLRQKDEELDDEDMDDPMEGLYAGDDDEFLSAFQQRGLRSNDADDGDEQDYAVNLPAPPRPRPMEPSNQTGETSSDDEIEEFHILLDLPELETMDISMEQHPPIKVVGIQSDQPILQLGSYIMKGTHDFLVGTQMLFSETPKVNEDGTPTKEVDLTYNCSLTKCVQFTRVLLQAKDAAQEQSTDAIPYIVGAGVSAEELTTQTQADYVEKRQKEGATDRQREESPEV